MNPIEWNSLSEEEKATLIDICKEDPVVFIETVCGMELLEYQKTIVRETFKTLRRPDRSEFRTKYLCESSMSSRYFGIACPKCGRRANNSNTREIRLPL